LDEPSGPAAARESAATISGRHATAEAERHGDSSTTSGRRRSSGANDDMLARILQREQPEPGP
jgi:hypothetical protein